jgi:F-type H+-transporting ATPase subunit gamma
MAGIKDLRLKIKALKNTSKITAAMKLVSAAKLKRAQDAYNRSKPYQDKIQDLTVKLAAAFEEAEHPLLKVRDVKRVRYMVFASDRGLCGSFNNGVLRTFGRKVEPGPGVEAMGIGRRARDYVARSARYQVVSGTAPANLATFANAQAIADRLITDYSEGRIDKVVLVYNRYASVLSQVPTFLQLLPFEKPEVAEQSAKGFKAPYLLEPDANSLVAELLPKIVAIQILKCLQETAVGEHSARMTAMDSATKNTKDLIGSYTLTMNRLRQAAITRELIEIVSGAEALKG